MLRIYKYNSPYEYKDFETHLFTTLRPGFDHANDRLYIDGQAYRISTINYIGLFNKLLDNQALYTISYGNIDVTYAVVHTNQSFALLLNPKLQGCILTLKIKKNTEQDILITLPENSFGQDIIQNTITLGGVINSTFILSAIYENGEYDWLIRSRMDGYGSGSTEVHWSEIQDKPLTFDPAAHYHDDRYSQLGHIHDYAATNHTHAQLHDQNTDVRILDTEPTLPTYVFGGLLYTALSVKDFRLKFTGEDKNVMEIVAVNNFGADYVEIYEEGILLTEQAFAFAYVDGRYQFSLNHPFKARSGKIYTLKIRRQDNTAFTANFCSSSTYNELGATYQPVSFTLDYTNNSGVLVENYNKTPLYFTRGSHYSKVETDGDNVKITAGLVYINNINLEVFHDARYSQIGHTHDYAATNHNHTNYIDTSSTDQTKAGGFTAAGLQVNNNTNPALLINNGSGSRKGAVYYDTTDLCVMLHNNARDGGLRIFDSDGRAEFTGNVLAPRMEAQHKRKIQSVASTAGFTHNCSSYDTGKITAQAATLTMAAPTGTPYDLQEFVLYLKDNGTARSLAWNAAFAGTMVALPAATTAGKQMVFFFVYNAATAKWELMNLSIAV